MSNDELRISLPFFFFLLILKSMTNNVPHIWLLLLRLWQTLHCNALPKARSHVCTHLKIVRQAVSQLDASMHACLVYPCRVTGIVTLNTRIVCRPCRWHLINYSFEDKLSYSYSVSQSFSLCYRSTGSDSSSNLEWKQSPMVCWEKRRDNSKTQK